MRALSIFLFFTLIMIEPMAQSLNSIPEKLFEGANSITITDQTQLEVNSIENFFVTRSYTTKILNRYAKRELSIAVPYDEFSSVKEAEIELRDAEFKLIEKFTSRDFDDIGSTSGVASDSRAKYLRVGYNKYPYYIKVTSKVDHKGSLHYPIWEPQPYENMAVVSAQFSIINHTENEVRFFSDKVSLKDSGSIENSKKYLWKVDSLKAYEYEPFAINYNYSPIVYTAPSLFKIDGYEGDMSTWESFGKWINKLNDGKNNLTEDQINEVTERVRNIESDYEKLKAVYSYLQESTRYVSIQLGIGGWSPFDASFVHEKKYGDCKALSFYTKSALEQVGINSYYALIRASSNAEHILPEFSNAHFNHAILMVPVDQDTVWLECTSQTNPFGYLGTFTGNRQALVITENGGVLRNTQRYTEKDNIQLTNAYVNLKQDGSAQAQISRTLSGIEVENDGFIYQLKESESDIKKWFYDELDFGSFTLDSYQVHPLKQSSVPSTGFDLMINLKKAATSNSDRLFIKPALFTNLNYIKLSKEKRNAPIEVRYPYQQIDSIHFAIEPMYFVESIQEDKIIESKFGKYSSTISVNEAGFLYTRKFTLKQGEYEPAEYQEFYDFIKEVQKVDRQKIVYSKKT